MGKSVVFRLITGDTPASWTISGGSAVKEGKGLKKIDYFPGSDSIFVEDNKDNDIKPESVVFRYNDVLSDPATEIIVPEENVVLINYLKAYPLFGKKYGIHDEDLLAQSSVDNYDAVEQAFGLIRESNPVKQQAMALAVIGSEVYGWSAVKCSAALKERAIKNPQSVISKMESPHYESSYLAALAFFSGIVKVNPYETSVIWNDGKEGEIIPLAKGERGLDKLGDFLAENTDASRLVLQEIGIRSDKSGSDKKAANETLESLEGITLEEAYIKFKNKFDKEVSLNKRNDLDWIKAKLIE